MEMPSVGAEQQRLTQLATGTWRGEEKLYPSEWDPAGGTATGTWTIQPGVDGFCLIVDYVEERDGKVVYRGHGVHGWDAEAQGFLSYWFDSIGILPKQPTRGTLDGNRYSYTDTSPMGTQRMTYAWTGDVFTFSIDKSGDGGETWAPMHEGRYQRVR